jgi:Uma2 family endonuclease
MVPATLEKRPKKRRKDPLADVGNLAELLDRLGNIPLERIRLHPQPGTATENDVILARQSPEKWRCELIDGVLVEKPMGTKEALWAGLVLHYLWDFLDRHDLGLVLGADGFVRLFPGRVRIPDASFFSWDTLRGGEFPDEAIASVVPDMAVEVLSRSNTQKEIDLKLDDYFRSGVKLVWIIDPKTQTAVVYSARDSFRMVKKNGILDAGAVVPGFTVSLKKLFAPRGRKKTNS